MPAKYYSTTEPIPLTPTLSCHLLLSDCLIWP